MNGPICYKSRRFLNDKQAQVNISKLSGGQWSNVESVGKNVEKTGADACFTASLGIGEGEGQKGNQTKQNSQIVLTVMTFITEK